GNDRDGTEKRFGSFLTHGRARADRNARRAGGAKPYADRAYRRKRGAACHGQTQRHHARPHGDQLYVRPTRGGPTGTTSARSMWTPVATVFGSVLDALKVLGAT